MVLTYDLLKDLLLKNQYKSYKIDQLLVYNLRYFLLKHLSNFNNDVK